MYQNIYNILFSTFIFQSINTTTASISNVLYLSCKQEEADTIFSVSVNCRCTKKNVHNAIGSTELLVFLF